MLLMHLFIFIFFLQCHNQLIEQNQLTALMPPNENYKILYEDLYKEHEILKKENENLKNELILLKKSDLEYRTINESLRNSLNIFQKKLKITNLSLIKLKKHYK